MLQGKAGVVHHQQRSGGAFNRSLLVLLPLSAPSEGKNTEARAHQKGLEVLMEAVNALGLVRLKMDRGTTQWFVPDLQISVGPRYQDRILIEYVASASSYRRDFGSMALLKTSNDGQVKRLSGKGEYEGMMQHSFRCYVLVVADEVWFKVPAFIGVESGQSDQNGLRLLRELHGLNVISRKYFKVWLLEELRKCAEEVAEAEPVDVDEWLDENYPIPAREKLERGPPARGDKKAETQR